MSYPKIIVSNDTWPMDYDFHSHISKASVSLPAALEIVCHFDSLTHVKVTSLKLQYVFHYLKPNETTIEAVKER